MSKRKSFRTALVLIAALAALSGVVDATSQTYAESAFKRALVTFAVARTLNGAISLAQGTEVAIEPGGVGVILSVGQILDPINDLVERFSVIMLIAASSLGLQIILLKMTAWWGLTTVLVIVSGIAIVSIWSPRLANSKHATTVSRILFIMLFIRFAVPLMIVGTNLVSDTFLTTEQEAGTAALEATRTEIEELHENATAPSGLVQSLPRDPDQSILDRLGSFIDDSLASMNFVARLDQLKESVSRATENIINLIAIFVLQTIILPLVFIWLLIEALKGLAARSVRRIDSRDITPG
jgi:hypothetical protein